MDPEALPHGPGPQITLQTTWSMWTSQWKGKPKVSKICDFDTMQGFCDCLNDASPARLADKCYLHIFKQGVTPMWEDPSNAEGGHFKLTTKNQKSSIALWQVLTRAMIEEQFPTHLQVRAFVAHVEAGAQVVGWMGPRAQSTLPKDPRHPT